MKHLLFSKKRKKTFRAFCNPSLFFLTINHCFITFACSVQAVGKSSLCSNTHVEEDEWWKVLTNPEIPFLKLKIRKQSITNVLIRPQINYTSLPRRLYLGLCLSVSRFTYTLLDRLPLIFGGRMQYTSGETILESGYGSRSRGVIRFSQKIVHGSDVFRGLISFECEDPNKNLDLVNLNVVNKEPVGLWWRSALCWVTFSLIIDQTSKTLW